MATATLVQALSTSSKQSQAGAAGSRGVIPSKREVCKKTLPAKVKVVSCSIALLALVGAATPAGAQDLWTFSLKVLASTCETVAVNQILERDMFIERNGGAYTVRPLSVGATERYTGWAVRHGFTTVLEESCPVLPPTTIEPVCSTDVGTITAIKRTSRSEAYKVVWLVAERNSRSIVDCSIVYTGSARRKKF